MIFRQLFDTTSSTYTYLLGDEVTREAVMVDPVFEKHARDVALVRELKLKLTHIIETHCHADHVTGAWLLRETLGAKIAVSDRVGAENVDLTLKHGDRISFGAHHLEVRSTPGHTDGCITLVTEDSSKAFTGDALLIRGAGRTDFQQGSAAILFKSIREQIFSLPDDCALYPAHDYAGRTSSSVAEEKEHNPRVGGRANEGDFVGYMENLGLPHPKKLDIAVPANMVAGKPEDGTVPAPASWGPVTVTYAGHNEIDPCWVAEHLDDVHVLDVRRQAEIDADLGTVKGSVVIPIDDLRDRVGEVPRDKPVVVLCRSGKRSAQATVILKNAGIEDVANIGGGMLQWTELGLG